MNEIIIKNCIKPEEPLEVGQLFLNGEALYMLAGKEESYVLIHLQSGYYWSNPVYYINKVFGTSQNKFVRFTGTVELSTK